MSDAKIIIILILFYLGEYKYLNIYSSIIYVKIYRIGFTILSLITILLSFKKMLLPMIFFIQQILLGKCSGISFADSIPLTVRKSQRILLS